MIRSDAILTTLLDIEDRQQRLDALLVAASERRRSSPAAALELAEHAAELGAELGAVHARAAALGLASTAAFELNRYQVSQRRALSALALLDLDPDVEPGVWEERLAALPTGAAVDLAGLLGDTLTALAIGTFRLGDYPRALLYASKEAFVKHILHDEVGEALALHGMGWGYDKVGLYQKALEHHFKALDILERVAPEKTASPLNGVADTYVTLGNYEQALAYSRRAIAILEGQPHNSWLLSTALRCIGIVHQQLGDYDSARKAFQESMAVSDSYGTALNLLSLGEMAFEQGDYPEALDCFQRCLSDLNESTRKRSRSQALTGLGNIHLARGDFGEALRCHGEALDYAEQIGSPVETYRAHEGLSRGYRALGDYPRALEHFEAYHAHKEKVLVEVSDIRSKVLMIQFDVEQLQKDQEIYRLRHVELAAANEDLRRLNAQLERLSNLDALTGLHNRRFLDAKLDYEIGRARRYDHGLAVAMIDIDHFKLINDTYSHAVGDEVMRALSEVFRTNTREIDLLIRYGGEEFVIVFPNTSLAHAREACEKIRLIVETHPWQRIAPGLEVTVSAGLAAFEHDPSGKGGAAKDVDARVLLGRADRNLYRAKRGGRNRVCG